MIDDETETNVTNKKPKRFVKNHFNMFMFLRASCNPPHFIWYTHSYIFFFVFFAFNLCTHIHILSLCFNGFYRSNRKMWVFFLFWFVLFCSLSFCSFLFACFFLDFNIYIQRSIFAIDFNKSTWKDERFWNCEQ